MKSIRQELQWASDILYSISCSARLDSEVLLAHCLHKDRSYLLTWPDRELTTQQQQCFHELVRRRLQPQPVAYLVGQREFYSLSLQTTEDTLVPRPETEMLVDCVLELIQDQPSAHILELGTGTGAIALAIKKHAAAAIVRATDVSRQALDVAVSNACQHELEIDFVVSDWYRNIAAQNQYDVIVSNPPYIAADDACLRQGDLPAEPMLALSSGETGLEAIQVIISSASNYLKPGAHLVLEHGFEQAGPVTDMLRQAAFEDIQSRRDFNDLQRMTLGRKPLTDDALDKA